MLVILLMMSLAAGCKAKEKTYQEDGFSITMTDGFIKKDLASATYYYESTTSLLTVLKEEFTMLEAVGITKDSELEEYVAAIEYNNQTEFSTFACEESKRDTFQPKFLSWADTIVIG